MENQLLGAGKTCKSASKKFASLLRRRPEFGAPVLASGAKPTDRQGRWFANPQQRRWRAPLAHRPTPSRPPTLTPHQATVHQKSRSVHKTFLKYRISDTQQPQSDPPEPAPRTKSRLATQRQRNLRAHTRARQNQRALPSPGGRGAGGEGIAGYEPGKCLTVRTRLMVDR
jgi:hypothetical protein